MINAKAFTLVETLIVVLLSTVALAGVYATLNVGQKAWVFYNDSVAVKKEARRALFALATELREAENLKVIQGPGGTTVHFHRPSIGAVTYTWTDKGEQEYRIIRRHRQ